jgi:hypothetical protein
MAKKRVKHTLPAEFGPICGLLYWGKTISEEVDIPVNLLKEQFSSGFALYTNF